MSIVPLPEGPRIKRVQVEIEGARFDNWTDYRIGADIFTPSNEFSMRCGHVGKDIIERFCSCGRAIKIIFGDGDDEHQVLAGWVEAMNDMAGKTISATDIAGRDRASDLIESSVPPTVTVAGRKFADIAEAICEPLGIPVVVSNELNRLAFVSKKKYKQALTDYAGKASEYQTKVWDLMSSIAEATEIGDYTWDEKRCKQALASAGIKAPVRPPWVGGIFKTIDEATPRDGESCWAFLQRYAARLEVHLWMSSVGELVLQRPRYDQDPLYTFMERESDPRWNNIIERSFARSIAGIPTRLTRTGRRIGSGEKKERLEATKTPSVFFTEEAVGETEPGVYQLETLGYPQDAIRVAGTFKRERWERDMQARSQGEIDRRAYYAIKGLEMGYQTLRVKVLGHDQGGTLYAPDTIARVIIEKLGIDRLFYVAGCEYACDSKAARMEGQTTTLTLQRLNAWVPET